MCWTVDTIRREVVMRCGFEVFGIAEVELARMKRGEPRKLAIGAVIRRRTAVPNAWIARELHLGHVSRVSRCVQFASCELIATLEARLAK